METYVMLVTLTEKGRMDIDGIAKRRDKNIEELQKNGIRIVADYALMGEYDFLYVVEAPNNQTMMEQIIHDSSSGTLVFRTMLAIPMEQFASMAANTKSHQG